MSELDELRMKPTDSYTPLEAAVMFLSGKHYDDAEQAAAELATLRAAAEKNAEIVRLAKLVVVRMPKQPEPDENGETGMTYLSASAPIWEAIDALAAALDQKRA